MSVFVSLCRVVWARGLLYETIAAADGTCLDVVARSRAPSDATLSRPAPRPTSNKESDKVGNDIADALVAELADDTVGGAGEAPAPLEHDTPASQALARAEHEAAGLLEVVEEVRRLAEREADCLPQAISEVFAEQRRDPVGVTEADEPVPAEHRGETPSRPRPAPRAAHTHEGSAPANRLPADERPHPSASPTPSQAWDVPPASRRFLARAWAVNAVTLLDMLFAGFLCIIFWLTFDQMASTLVAVTRQPAGAEDHALAAAEPRLTAATPRPSPLAPRTTPVTDPRSQTVARPSAAPRGAPRDGDPQG